MKSYSIAMQGETGKRSRGQKIENYDTLLKVTDSGWKVKEKVYFV